MCSFSVAHVAYYLHFFGISNFFAASMKKILVYIVKTNFDALIKSNIGVIRKLAIRSELYNFLVRHYEN